LIAKEDVSGKIEVRYVNTKNEPIYSVLVDGGPRAPEKIMGQPKMLNKEPKKHTYRLGKTITVK